MTCLTAILSPHVIDVKKKAKTHVIDDMRLLKFRQPWGRMEGQAIVTDDMIRVLAKTFPASWQ